MKKEQISTQFYEVNPHTMIIFPKKSGSIVYSEIYEVDSHYTSKFTPFELIKTSCNFFGSSYEGRRRNEIPKKNILSKGCLYFYNYYRRNIIYVTNY
ncbi:competence protein ComK [Listeria monocytogenes]|uniref:Competence protein ComK n=3 Tax=Listeria monocytogenes TaxID=1639 RepID=A0A3T1TUE4_LISMN|nr:competence protein ComK [Listeria monocytogenes]KHK38374.1 comK' [Listeria monocytogenes SHL010]EAA0207977.1 competence protein ComK [Listeria monocytogenes]EAA0211086.1 competence protein ComK [Listeria monocytogenes]EAC2317414.1 competence protein ComK [Listeria monocytogenes]